MFTFLKILTRVRLQTRDIRYTLSVTDHI